MNWRALLCKDMSSPRVLINLFQFIFLKITIFKNHYTTYTSTNIMCSIQMSIWIIKIERCFRFSLGFKHCRSVKKLVALSAHGKYMLKRYNTIINIYIVCDANDFTADASQTCIHTVHEIRFYDSKTTIIYAIGVIFYCQQCQNTGYRPRVC